MMLSNEKNSLKNQNFQYYIMVGTRQALQYVSVFNKKHLKRKHEADQMTCWRNYFIQATYTYAIYVHMKIWLHFQGQLNKNHTKN